MRRAMISGGSSARRSSRRFSSGIEGGRMKTLTTSAAAFSRTCMRALVVDVEQDVLAVGQRLVDLAPRRSVEVAVHLGPFQQIAAVAHGGELSTR